MNIFESGPMIASARDDQALNDLRLPESLRMLLTPPLQTLGFSIQDTEVRAPYELRRHSVITNGPMKRISIHVPKAFLNGNYTTRKELVALPYAFKKHYGANTTLF